MKITAALANGAWLAASLPAWHDFQRGLARPEETQWQILRGLLRDNSASEFGRLHRFGGIRTYEQYRQRVPIMDYAGLEPWVRRIMRGDPAVLTRERVTRLVPTSGSTGGRKFIPFTAGLQRQFNRAIAAWTVDLSRRHPAVPFGPAYWSVSPCLPVRAGQVSAVPIGFDSDSAYLGGILQPLVETTFAAPSALRLVTDLECFRYLTLLSLLRQPELRFASVWHPSFLMLLLDALPTWWEELLADLERGGCRRAATEPPAVRAAVGVVAAARAGTFAAPCRSREPRSHLASLAVGQLLGRRTGRRGVGRPASALAASRRSTQGFACDQGVRFDPFRSWHPLAVTSHFFEFIDESGAVLPAHALQRDRRYEVIVSTAGGLWRYRLGDFVEVNGFVENTPSLRFIGRGGGVSDLRGEKLIESFVTRAVLNVCGHCAFRPSFAMLAPEIDGGGVPSYVLFVEGEALDELATLLDAELRGNPHYAYCRDLGQLGPVRCVRVAGGAYRTFCEVNVSEGRRLGEIKPQVLSTRTDWGRHFKVEPFKS